MDSDLILFWEITILVTVFLSAGLYYVTKWAEIEKRNIIEINDQTTKHEILSSNENSVDLPYLKNISIDELNLLLQEKISNIEDLKNKINTDKDVLELSEKLGIRRKLVEEWITLGEFSNLHGMTSEYIMLLKNAGITNVKDLSNRDPGHLWRKLAESNPDAKSLPSLGMIRYWVRNSEKIMLEQIEQN